ncbi:MAG: tRNA-dihydrouridine synthase [Candidatus Woesearchaeota archaeon]|nr:MAG: tRNA-dihydrouridine synthase [Candidatus Woesearchaeota archaeon]
MLPRFKSKAFLAPMAGVSDYFFRERCLVQGAGLVVSELTSVEGLARGHYVQRKDSDLSILASRPQSPLSIQLFGSDVKTSLKAVDLVEPYCDIIDYNLGCPAPHITKQEAGAALLAKDEALKKLFSALVKHSDKPITAKIRAGISENNLVHIKIGKLLEQEGVDMISLHARTVKQGYSGTAQLEWIKELKDTLDIPVCGNGDITTPVQAKQMMEQTGCDFVMVGRGARGNPFIFKQIHEYFETGTYKNPTDLAIKQEFLSYLDCLTDHFSLASIKAKAMLFTKNLKGASVLRTAIANASSVDAVREVFS